MFTTAGPYRSTRSAKSGNTCADAPGVLGVAAPAGGWKPRPKARSAPRKPAWSRFMCRSCCSKGGGTEARPGLQRTRPEKSRPMDDAPRDLLGRGERHLAQHRHDVFSHRTHEEARGAVFARDFGGPRRRRVGLDEDRQARQAVAVDDLWHRLRAPGEGPLELRHLVEARRGLGHRPAGVRALRLVARAGIADPAAHARLEDRLQVAARRARTDLEIGERV